MTQLSGRKYLEFLEVRFMEGNERMNVFEDW